MQAVFFFFIRLFTVDACSSTHLFKGVHCVHQKFPSTCWIVFSPWRFDPIPEFTASPYGASLSRLDTSHSVGLLWTSDQLDAETSTWQDTTIKRANIYADSGIRTQNTSKLAAADLWLRPRGYWDRHGCEEMQVNYAVSVQGPLQYVPIYWLLEYSTTCCI